MPRPPGIAIVPLNLARFRCGRLEQAPGRQQVLASSRSLFILPASTCELHERTLGTFSRCFGNSIPLRHKCGSQIEQGFSDASRRCTVARASEGPNFERLYGHTPIGLAIASNLDFNNSTREAAADQLWPGLHPRTDRPRSPSRALASGRACALSSTPDECEVDESEGRWLRANHRGSRCADTV